MPRIAAGTLREHREMMQNALIDAAEQILHDGGRLTAGEVASAAGIARNSLYRYVASVDDLKVLVLNKHLPQWSQGVADAVEAAADPREKVIAYVRTNLDKAAPGGHGWLMKMAEGIAANTHQELASMHTQLARLLAEAVASTGLTQPELLERIITGIVQAGFTRLEAGDDPQQVTEGCLRAASAVLEAGVALESSAQTSNQRTGSGV